jgi:hypothetical protein
VSSHRTQKSRANHGQLLCEYLNENLRSASDASLLPIPWHDSVADSFDRQRPCYGPGSPADSAACPAADFPATDFPAADFPAAAFPAADVTRCPTVLADYLKTGRHDTSWSVGALVQLHRDLSE